MCWPILLIIEYNQEKRSKTVIVEDGNWINISPCHISYMTAPKTVGNK